MAKNSRTQSLKKGIFGVYSRKLLFFAIVFLTTSIGYLYIGPSQFQADQKSVEEYINEKYFGANNLDVAIEVNEKGNVIINGELTKDSLEVVDGLDELRLVVVDQPKKKYDSLKITLKVPKNSAKNTKSEILAIHGVGDYSSRIKDSDTIVYEASNVSSLATITIVAKIPAGVITHPFYQDILTNIEKLEFSYWLVLAIILPLITIIYMFFFLAYQRRIHRIDIPQKAVSSLPMAIPPAIVGVLYRQKVGPRELAATLIDLARRGDIVILDRERGFAFGKGKFDQRLLPYEKILLSKIFKENVTSEYLEIEKRVSSHLYSKKMSAVSFSVHAIATRMGYFRLNPIKLHIKYRLVGFCAFLIGISGFLLSIFISSLPEVSALFWLGMMGSALIIAFTAGNIPLRSEIGRDTLSNWLAFRKYLTDPEPIPYSNDIEKLFEEYLPYAIVLNCESAWVKRFEDHNFVIPEWFVTDKEGLGIDDFCLSLFPIISYIGRSFASIREPGFE